MEVHPAMDDRVAKKERRTELAWVQLVHPVRITTSDTFGSSVLVSGQTMRLYLEPFDGIPTVLVERNGTERLRIPSPNIAGFIER
jgi:hypothetical protein